MGIGFESVIYLFVTGHKGGYCTRRHRGNCKVSFDPRESQHISSGNAHGPWFLYPATTPSVTILNGVRPVRSLPEVPRYLPGTASFSHSFDVVREET